MSLGHAWDEGRQAWNRLCRHPDGPGDGDRALIALSDIGTVRRALEHAELQAVRIARRHRKSWSEIAVQLGVTRQSAWERWRDVDEHAPADTTLVAVPDVIGYTWVEARHTLNQAGLVAVHAVPQATPSAPQDWIVSDQSPRAGTRGQEWVRGTAVARSWWRRRCSRTPQATADADAVCEMLPEPTDEAVG